MLAASKVGDFKMLTYWCSLILAVFSFYCPSKLFSILIGATLKGKIMLPMGTIFFPLTVAPFMMWFLYIETYSIVQKKKL